MGCLLSPEGDRTGIASKLSDDNVCVLVTGHLNSTDEGGIGEGQSGIGGTCAENDDSVAIAIGRGQGAVGDFIDFLSGVCAFTLVSNTSVMSSDGLSQT